jgi:hypothetical protein
MATAEEPCTKYTVTNSYKQQEFTDFAEAMEAQEDFGGRIDASECDDEDNDG